VRSSCCGVVMVGGAGGTWAVAPVIDTLVIEEQRAKRMSVQDLYDVAGQVPGSITPSRLVKTHRFLSAQVCVASRRIPHLGQHQRQDTTRPVSRPHEGPHVESASWSCYHRHRGGPGLLRPTYDVSDGEDGFVPGGLPRAGPQDGTVASPCSLRIKSQLLVKYGTKNASIQSDTDRRSHSIT